MREASLGVLLAAALAAACADDPRRLTLDGRDAKAIYVASYARPELPASLEEWDARADEVRARLLEATGLEIPRETPETTVLQVRTVATVRVEDLLIDGFGGQHIPAALYLPATATGPVPGVVLNAGHDPFGQNTWYIRLLAWRLASNGVAALTLDWWGMGTRFGPDQRHVPMGLRSILAGLVPATPILEEPLRALDYLASRPEIDASRLGMAGQSGGAVVTMHLAALDERIAAAVVVDIVATGEYMFETLPGWGDPDAMVPGSFGFTSHGEILALVAPRPLLVLSGDADLIGPTEIAAEELVLTRGVYELAGAGAEFGHQGFATAHCWCDVKIAATLAFFGEKLLGAPIVSAASAPAESAPVAAAPADDPRWPELVAERYAVSPPAPASAAAAIAELAARNQALAAALGFARRPAESLGLPPLDGNQVAVLWLSDAGRARAVGNALIARATWLVKLEPAGMGAAISASADDRRYLAQNGIAVGRPLLGLGAEDVVWAADGARQDGARRVVAVCDGPQAALACLAAVAAAPDAIDGLALAGLPADFVTTFGIDQPDPTLYYVTPGLGALANPEMLVAGAAPRPVAVVGAPAGWGYATGVFAALDAADDLDLAAPDLILAAEHVFDAL